LGRLSRLLTPKLDEVSIMKPQFLTFLILLAAGLLYWLGFTISSLILLSGGAVLELWFWSRVFGIGEDRHQDETRR
jgi:hypothetical protein